jgi:RNA polymerase sigma-70 factor (ECF subfamily)
VTDARAEQVEALYARHARGVRAHLASFVGATEAEDLLQDVFERAHRALPEHRGESRVSTWLYRIATHAALDRLRSRSLRDREGMAEDIRASAATPKEQPDVELGRARMRACIAGLVSALPTGQREVVELAELRGLSDRETAEALGITVGAAKIRLHRGRSALKKLVACECHTYVDEGDGLMCEPVRSARVTPR